MLAESEAKLVPHDEQCDQALKHYEEISNEASHYSSFVPAAIEFYRKYYVRRGERKMVPTIKQFEEALEEGWSPDPWLNPSGRPIMIGENEHYWIVVKGTPEQIAALEPFADLPEDEEEEPEVGADPYGLRTDYILYGADGKPSREPEPGFVVMHKDHVYAKGTVYTLPPKPATPWGLSIQLAGLSGHLGVDEAHDVITGILRDLSA